MNLEELNEKSSVYRGFQTTLHLCFGVVYIFIGGIIIYTKSFLTLSLEPPVFAYMFGGMVSIYGIFRLWRGYQNIKLSKMEKLRKNAMNIANSRQ